MSSTEYRGRLLLGFVLLLLAAFYIGMPRNAGAQTGPPSPQHTVKTTGGGTGGVPPAERAKPTTGS